MTPVNRTTPQFAELLSRALTEPGVASRAYSAFHGTSTEAPSRFPERSAQRIFKAADQILRAGTTGEISAGAAS
jgi:hypothetical protein